MQQQQQQERITTNSGLRSTTNATAEEATYPSPTTPGNKETFHRCAIFWDYENCPPPSGMPGYLVVENIRKAVHHFGMITSFKAYLQIGENTKKSLRSELQSSGVSLTDTPHNARKDAADKMILVDMLAYAIDNPPPATIVLISGDRDFVYALSVLRNRKYNILLIVPNKGAAPVLKSQSDIVLEWRYDVLSQDISSTFSLTPNSGLSPEKNSPTPTQIPSINNNSIVNHPNMNNSFNATTFASPLKELTKIRNESKPPSRVGSAVNLSINTDKKEEEDNSNEPDPLRYIYSPACPGYFDVLVEVLSMCRLAGDPRPKRKKVAADLLARNPLLCSRTNVNDISDYFQMAAESGIVILGGPERGNDGWISMNDNFVTKF